MENLLNITELNDFVFCPASIYFHKVYGGVKEILYQERPQIRGKKAHETVDEKHFKKKGIVTSIDVYSEEFGLIGKIDIYDTVEKKLVERKRKVNTIYDGYIYQIYAQYYCMIEMGYSVEKLEIYSLEDNKSYDIALPENNTTMDDKFRKIIEDFFLFDLQEFIQTNATKCNNCIYRFACDRNENK